MKPKLKYANLSDKEVAAEMEARLKEMKELLAEIRDSLRSAAEIE